MSLSVNSSKVGSFRVGTRVVALVPWDIWNSILSATRRHSLYKLSSPSVGVTNKHLHICTLSCSWSRNRHSTTRWSRYRTRRSRFEFLYILVRICKIVIGGQVACFLNRCTWKLENRNDAFVFRISQNRDKLPLRVRKYSEKNPCMCFCAETSPKRCSGNPYTSLPQTYWKEGGGSRPNSR